MLIGGLQKLTLVDYPGHVAATVFTSGCNFLCPFCHNPELVDLSRKPPYPYITEEKLFKEGIIDYIAMDIKGPLENYHDITKTEIDLEKIHQSTTLARNFPDYEFRTTVVPTLHKKSDFLSIARWLEGSKKYFLQQFRPETTLDSAFSKIRPYSDEKLSEFCQMIKPYFEECEVRI